MCQGDTRAEQTGHREGSGQQNSRMGRQQAQVGYSAVRLLEQSRDNHDEQGKRKEGARQRRDQRGDTHDNAGGGAMYPPLPV